jgi:FkbM family methyltransferase
MKGHREHSKMDLVFCWLKNPGKGPERRNFAGLILDLGILFLDIICISRERVHSILSKDFMDGGSGSRKRRVNDYYMRLMPRTPGIHHDLYYYGTRERFSTEYFRDIIGKDSIVLEIGANIGYYAILESLKSETGHVYAIEPVMSNLESLRMNLELNGCKNVTLFHLAVGDMLGKRKIFVYDKCNWSGLLPNLNGTIVGEEEVEMTTIDDFLTRYVKGCPNIVRMDVEGFEYEIIKGASDFLKRCEEGYLFIEFHPHLAPMEKMLELTETIATSGYAISAIFREFPNNRFPLIKLYNFFLVKAGRLPFGGIDPNIQNLKRALKQGSVEVFFHKACST